MPRFATGAFFPSFLLFKTPAGSFCVPSVSSPQSFFTLDPSHIKASIGIRERLDEETLRVKKKVPFSQERERCSCGSILHLPTAETESRLDTTTHIDYLSAVPSPSLPLSSTPLRWRGRKDDGGS